MRIEGRPHYSDRIIMHESLTGVQRYAAAANYVDASPVAGLAEWQRTPMVMLLLLFCLNFAGSGGTVDTQHTAQVARAERG
jgi:hypothetical protein